MTGLFRGLVSFLRNEEFPQAILIVLSYLPYPVALQERKANANVQVFTSLFSDTAKQTLFATVSPEPSQSVPASLLLVPFLWRLLSFRQHSGVSVRVAREMCWRAGGLLLLLLLCYAVLLVVAAPRGGRVCGEDGVVGVGALRRRTTIGEDHLGLQLPQR
jgi:hypothetical protein